MTWLNIPGCEVMGISLKSTTGDNHFIVLKKNLNIIDRRGDNRNGKYPKNFE